MIQGVSVNLPRISQNLRAFNLLNTVRASQTRLFDLQNQLATGLKFQRPSDDITGATAAGRFDQRLDTLKIVERNLNSANAVLGSGEQAMSDAIDLLRNARDIALQGVGDTIGADERASLSTVVESLTDQVIAVANRKHLDTFLFSGRAAGSYPFQRTDYGVQFTGDAGRLQTIVDSDLSQDTFTISGQEFFAAVSPSVQGNVDLNPAVTPDTRLADLRGSIDTGVTPGRIHVSDGTTDALIDLSGADTIGDVMDQLNAHMPDTLTATLSNNSIVINSTRADAAITIEDDGGSTAIELGIIQATPVSVINGKDLNPRLTARSTLASLQNGAGVDLSAGLTITNGPQQAQVDLAGATTIEEVLNRINRTNIGVRAEIAPDGDHLLVRNELSGADLRVSERGGTAAAALGIRSLQTGTPLTALNHGQGVGTVQGDDFRITTADGTAVNIDLDSIAPATTGSIQDVINLLNSAGGGAITAGLSNNGGGIVIQDNTTGAGTLTIEKLGLSPAIDDLGLNVTASGGVITGTDTNGVHVNSPFSALLDLKNGLANNDREAINAASARLEAALTQMERVQGQLAAKANQMRERSSRVEDESTATQVLLSDTRDVDIADAVVNFQQVQTALQANLQTASQVLNLSLLDYLR